MTLSDTIWGYTTLPYAIQYLLTLKNMTLTYAIWRYDKCNALPNMTQIDAIWRYKIICDAIYTTWTNYPTLLDRT